MKNKKNSILDTIASILVVFIFLAVFWYLISEWISAIKNPQTRYITLFVTGVTIIAVILINYNPEFVQSLINK
jgi:hypothetical protein